VLQDAGKFMKQRFNQTDVVPLNGSRHTVPNAMYEKLVSFALPLHIRLTAI
jgi:hypothetical protein